MSVRGTGREMEGNHRVSVRGTGRERWREIIE